MKILVKTKKEYKEVISFLTKMGLCFSDGCEFKDHAGFPRWCFGKCITINRTKTSFTVELGQAYNSYTYDSLARFQKKYEAQIKEHIATAKKRIKERKMEQTAELIVYKKVQFIKNGKLLSEEALYFAKRSSAILKLRIAQDVRRNMSMYKCRASMADILDVVTTSGRSKKITEDDLLLSFYDRTFVYEGIGATVIPDGFDSSREECAEGIHFFRTLKEAAQYEY